MTTSIKLAINKFDISSMYINCKILIIGDCRSGKTTLIKDIVPKFRIPVGTIISPDIDSYLDFKFKCCAKLYDKFDTKLVHQLCREQDRRRRKSICKNPSSFLVMDDCIQDKKDYRALFKSQAIQGMIMNSRCYRYTIINSMQSVILPHMNQLNHMITDYIFLFRVENLYHIKRLYDLFGGGVFRSFEMFRQVFLQCTENEHECMVIRHRKISENIEDIVFWYKVPIVK